MLISYTKCFRLKVKWKLQTLSRSFGCKGEESSREKKTQGMKMEKEIQMKLKKMSMKKKTSKRKDKMK